MNARFEADPIPPRHGPGLVCATEAPLLGRCHESRR
ncbi:hypothetical protein MYXO_03540 [Myxococcaceae bacterium]|nr:hypothetical protein MYXO_03540 [Myxococcaceae bacterium]